MFIALLVILLLQTNLLPYVIPYLVFGLYMFWVPQIVRNVRRGTRYAFSWWYLAGVSLGRGWFLAYYWGGAGGRDNLFFLEKSSAYFFSAS